MCNNKKSRKYLVKSQVHQNRNDLNPLCQSNSNVVLLLCGSTLHWMNWPNSHSLFVQQGNVRSEMHQNTTGPNSFCILNCTQLQLERGKHCSWVNHWILQKYTVDFGDLSFKKTDEPSFYRCKNIWAALKIFCIWVKKENSVVKSSCPNLFWITHVALNSSSRLFWHFFLTKVWLFGEANYEP